MFCPGLLLPPNIFTAVLSHTHTHTHTHIVSLHVCSVSCVQLFATPWAVAHQAPLFMEFSRQVCWSGLPFDTPDNLPESGIKPTLPVWFFITAPSRKYLNNLHLMITIVINLVIILVEGKEGKKRLFVSLLCAYKAIFTSWWLFLRNVHCVNRCFLLM